MPKTGGELLAEQLVSEGVETLFGVPGIQLDYAVDGLAQQRDQIRYISARHEQGAAYMADGYARVAGRPGVCMVVPGPGLLNAGAALATAFSCSSPVVCIAGQIPSGAIGKGLGMLHEVQNQGALLASLTKWSGIARKPEDIPGLVNEAFQRVSSGAPRPVGIEIPPDVLQATTDSRAIPAAQPQATQPDPRSIEHAAIALGKASRPVIYVGGGVRDARASAALQRVAEALGAPVVMSRNGKGAISDRHPLALSRLGGSRVLEDADAVLAVGTRFITQQGKPVVYPGSRTLIAINANEADTLEPRSFDVTVIADAHLALSALAEVLPRRRDQPDLDGVREWTSRQLEHVAPQVGWLKAIREAMPDDGILVDELTQVGYPSRLAYPVYEAGTYVTPGYQGTLGYGFPTGLGVKVGRPDSTVVSINGDGGFGWSLQELSTASKYDIGLIVVVFVNGAFGNVKRIQSETFGRTLGVDLANPDYGRLAAAFGVDSVKAPTPQALTSAIRSASGIERPLLIEVPVGDMPSPWGLISEPSFGAPLGK